MDRADGARTRFDTYNFAASHPTLCVQAVSCDRLARPSPLDLEAAEPETSLGRRETKKH
jgi:hypothetical protein